MLVFKEVIGWERDEADVSQSDGVSEDVASTAVNTNNKDWYGTMHDSKWRRTAPPSPLTVHSSSIIPVTINGGKMHKNSLLPLSTQKDSNDDSNNNSNGENE